MDKWDYIELKSSAQKKVLYIEEHTHRVTENICFYTSDKGLKSRIHRKLKNLNSPKVHEPIKKWANELNRTLSKKEVQVAKKHIKKCSPSLAIKEMQIKSTLRFYLTPAKITMIKITTNNKCWGTCGKKGALIPCW
jgi:hypothetical protein